MHTPVFIKMDARDLLLLSEGVCHQLDIISYHPDVVAQKAARPKKVKAPASRVCLLQSMNVRSGQSSLVPVHVEATTDLQVDDSLLQPTEDGIAHVRVSNT